MKICSLCKVEKSADKFPPSTYVRKDGTRNLSSWCRECFVVRSIQYQKENPERVRMWNAKKHRKKKYGLSDGRYLEMVEAQGGKCAICGQEETHRTRGGYVADLCVDHCHATGKVRGLLCFNCNTGIGRFRDDTEVLQRAIVYLCNGGVASEDGK